MNDSDFGEVIEAVKVLQGCQLPWAVCGGWAIDLFLDRVTRPHKDVDFAVLRRDQLVLQEYLLARGWSLEKAVQGRFIPWEKNEWIAPPVHVVWCRNPQASPDFMELLFNEVDEVRFYYRRDLSISLPVEKMIIASPSGIPILAPEIVLLYKSKNPEDDPAAMADFRNVSAMLSPASRAWLAEALAGSSPNHVWLNDLR